MFEEDNEQIIKKKMKSARIKHVIITLVIALLVAVASSEYTLYYYLNRYNVKEDYSEDASKNIDSIAKTLKNIRKTYVDNAFIGEIDEEKVFEEAIKGYINGLGDEYSEYMTADEWEDFQADALGNYVGVGIYISTDKSGNVIVLSPIKGTPAEEAGLESGDIIAFVNDESTVGMTPEEVSSRVKGEEGTKVKITVIRDSEYKYFDIERKAIKVYHVESEMLDNNIGYISLATFDEGCAEEIKDEYIKLEFQGAKKIILDLRNNTGGLVVEALNILDLILPNGATELITVDARDSKKTEYSKNDPIINCDIVVLVNEYSASASEILVGALKDNNKATIVGTNTYGKGVIQTVIPIPDGSALKLTTNEYYTPNMTKINKIGIEPDYVVEQDEETEEDEQLEKAIEILK
jgi:carboxyl-terminal processing protease